MAHQLTQDEVLAGRDALPAFPRVINEILASLDDPDANLNLLVGFIGRDPVLAARVFSLANAGTNKTRQNATVRDLYTATSLIGLAKLREMAVMASLTGFRLGALPEGMSPEFWRHSAAAGVSAQQVAAHARQSPDLALIAGLLHDIGQLWLFRFKAESFLRVWQASVSHIEKICHAEQAEFGVDHATIGAWLAENRSTATFQRAGRLDLAGPLAAFHSGSMPLSRSVLPAAADQRVSDHGEGNGGACRITGMRCAPKAPWNRPKWPAIAVPHCGQLPCAVRS